MSSDEALLDKTPTVGIVTSAAYVGSEMAAEFGQLPPAFLPFGHHRLYGQQVALLAPLVNRLYLTLPASFDVPAADAAWLERNDVTVLPLPDELTLGESLHHALILSGASGQVRLLHGDTYFTEPLPAGSDLITVAPAPEFYRWGSVTTRGRRATFDARDEPETILSGYFAFQSADALVRATLTGGKDFLACLAEYSALRDLQPVQHGGWLDFGHLQTYYASRSQVNIARSFNTLTFSQHTVLKGGSNPEKIDAEAGWFEGIPAPLRLYTPSFLGREEGGYRIAYEAAPTLHELFVFGALKVPAWEKIMDVCYGFLQECARHPDPDGATDEFQQEMSRRALTRLTIWADQTGQDLDATWSYGGRPLPSLRQVLEDCSAISAGGATLPGVLHGDFCFPNIFFVQREELIRVIDPRGSNGSGRRSVYGDIRYDVAKLNHSLQGYDYILAGRYQLTGAGSRDVGLAFPETELLDHLRAASTEHHQALGTADPRQVAALTALLFLSMLPLHADRPDRQEAFLANALRIYAEMME